MPVVQGVNGVRFVFGTEDDLRVSGSYQVGRYPGRDHDSAWARSNGGATWSFRVRRGKLEEFRSFSPPHKHVYARVLPPDVLPELDKVDAEIAEAEAVLQKLRGDRQALLLAAAQRGKPIRYVPPNAGAERLTGEK